MDEQPLPAADASPPILDAPSADPASSPAAPPAVPAPFVAPSAATTPFVAPTAPLVAPAPLSGTAPEMASEHAVVPAAPAEPSRRRRSRGATIAIWLLSVALVLTLAAGAWLAFQFVSAQEQISDHEDRIEEQRELIEQKESFGTAMAALLETTDKFDGVLTASIVPWKTYERFAERAWTHRWDATKLAADTGQVVIASDLLESVWTTAQQELASNASGTAYEAVIDRLGGGFVRSVLDDEQCGDDEGILGCVYESDPYLVHFDAAGNTQPYMTDELRTGISYHEFAHVLQFTNPTPTAVALKAFDGDLEVMADCFVLTYLDGWTLDHRIWTSDYEYWDVNIGYGVVCSEPQRQAVRDWYAQLGVAPQVVTAID